MGTRELARHLKVSPAAVVKATKSGRIEKSADGKYDSEKAACSWTRHTDPAKQRKQAGQFIGSTDGTPLLTGSLVSAPPELKRQAAWPEWPRQLLDAALSESAQPIPQQGESVSESDFESFQFWRTKRERCEARKAQLELAKQSGALIDGASIQESMREIIVGLKSSIQQIPVKVSDRIATMTNVREIRGLLAAAVDNELRRASESLTKLVVKEGMPGRKPERNEEGDET